MDSKQDAMYQWRLQQAARAIAELARKEGISVAEVYREMERCIQQARRNPDPAARANFARIPCVGEYPTPEELIAFGATLSKAARPKKPLS